MGDPRIGRARARFRRARRRDAPARGVAAVVGTLLALLVFFALFGIFLTEYLPLWMNDNEAEFTSDVSAAFAQFKSNVDAQSALDGPNLYTTTFPLSSQGVPLLAQPTEGTLTLLPPSCPAGFTAAGAPKTPTACEFETETFGPSAGTATARPWNQTTTTAVLEMQLPNRYYTTQTFYFEDDAVIQEQYGSHSVIVGPPPLTVSKSGTNITVATTFLGLYGNSTVVIGQGSEEVYSQLVTSSFTDSNGLFLAANKTAVPFTFTFEVGTHNLCPWYTYLEDLVADAGLTSGQYKIAAPASGTTGGTLPPSTTACQDTSGYTYDLVLKIYDVTYGSALQSSVEVSIGAGVA